MVVKSSLGLHSLGTLSITLQCWGTRQGREGERLIACLGALKKEEEEEDEEKKRHTEKPRVYSKAKWQRNARRRCSKEGGKRLRREQLGVMRIHPIDPPSIFKPNLKQYAFLSCQYLLILLFPSLFNLVWLYYLSPPNGLGKQFCVKGKVPEGGGNGPIGGKGREKKWLMGVGEEGV